MVAELVSEAQLHYADAAAVILRNGLYSSAELRGLEMEIVRANDLFRGKAGRRRARYPQSDDIRPYIHRRDVRLPSQLLRQSSRRLPRRPRELSPNHRLRRDGFRLIRRRSRIAKPAGRVPAARRLGSPILRERRGARAIRARARAARDDRLRRAADRRDLRAAAADRLADVPSRTRFRRRYRRATSTWASKSRGSARAGASRSSAPHRTSRTTPKTSS